MRHSPHPTRLPSNWLRIASAVILAGAFSSELMAQQLEPEQPSNAFGPAQTQIQPPGQPQTRFAPPVRYRLGVVTVTVPLDPPSPVRPGQPAPNLTVPAATALRVVQVQRGSAAARAGFEVGDLIVAANGKRTQNVNDLTQAIATSGGFLQMTIRNVRTNQNQQIRVALDPIGPGPNPPGPSPPQGGPPIVAAGRLQSGVVAIGGETTGYALRTSSGVRYELDFNGRPEFIRLARQLNGRQVLVTGVLESRSGPQIVRRPVIVADSLAPDSLRPRPFNLTPESGPARTFEADPGGDPEPAPSSDGEIQ